MGLQIEDGKGRGNSVSVNASNKLATEAVSSSVEHHVNHADGNAYAVPFSQSNTAAGDCIFYMKNTSDTDMIIEGITLGVHTATADDSIYFKLGDVGTRNSATDLTPVNLNRGSGKSATGEFEKGADLDGGSATLTGGEEFERIVIAGITDKVSANFNFVQDIILPKNKTFTIWVDGSGTGTWFVTVNFNYHNLED